MGKYSIIYCPVAKKNVERVPWDFKYHAYSFCKGCGQYPDANTHPLIERGEIDQSRLDFQKAWAEKTG